MLEVLDGILGSMRTLAGLFHRNLGLGLVSPDSALEFLLLSVLVRRILRLKLLRKGVEYFLVQLVGYVVLHLKSDC